MRVCHDGIQPRTPTSAIFLEFAPDIAKDLGIEWEGEDSAQRLWNAAFESADSFRKKGSMVKMSRWFSWNQCAEEQISDWHTFKMVLTHHFKSKGLVLNEAEQENEKKDREMLQLESKRRKNSETKNWQTLKQSAGAFKLAWKIITPQLHRHVKMLQMATRPVWSWYTRHVTEIKTTSDAIDSAISMVLEDGSAWSRDKHLCELAMVLGSDEIAQFEQDDDPLAAHKLFELTVELLGRRTWSLAVRHALPPEQYAGALSPESDVRRTSLELLRKHHECLLEWENEIANCGELQGNSNALRLKQDVSFAVDHPARLVMDAFESIDYDPRRLRQHGYKSTGPKEAGEHLLETLVETFPDNKIVEDVHNALRLEAKGNKHNQMTPSTMQSVCMNSGVFESRGIKHEAQVSKESFLEKMKSKSESSCIGDVKIFYANTHSLPSSYIKICDSRSWHVLNEESLDDAVAAWAWIQFSSSCRFVNATAAAFSKVARRGLVFQSQDLVSSPMISLGASAWGALMWPLEQYDSDSSGNLYYCLQHDDAQASWIFLNDPKQWRVVEMEPVWHLNKVCLQCSEVMWQNLLDAMLKDKKCLGKLFIHSIICYSIDLPKRFQSTHLESLELILKV